EPRLPEMADQTFLVRPPYPVPALLERGIRGEPLQRAELTEIPGPAVADRLVKQCREPGIAEHQPAPRRHAVGLVRESLRPQRMKLAQHAALQQLRVQRRDTIDGMTADRRKVRHSHIALAAF